MCKLGAIRTTKVYGRKPSVPGEQRKVKSTQKELIGTADLDATIPYRAMLGSLLWLSEGTRPEIKYIVSQLGKYAINPKEAHWSAMKRVFRYLAGTADYGILYSAPQRLSVTSKQFFSADMPRGFASWSKPEDNQVDIQGFVDADHAGDVDDRRSITGYIFQLAGGPISWQSTSQASVALSSMEAEYMSLCEATKEASWLRQILEELGFNSSKAIHLNEDNVSCINFADHPGNHRATKHIDTKYHFVREQVHEGRIIVDQIGTDEQLADIFTKALPRHKFEYFRDKLVVSKATLQLKVVQLAADGKTKILVNS